MVFSSGVLPEFGALKMSGSEVRRVSRQDIQLVQNLIERCLQLYMNQKEVVATLLDQAKIEPGFTELVWQKLEEENQEFFKAYHLRLIVKEQIIVFNKLLEKQVELMSQMWQTGVSSMSGSNGSHIPPIHQNSAFYTSGPTLKEEKMHHPISCTISNAFTNGSFGVSAQSGRVNAVPDMLSMESSNMGSVQGLNGATIKTEAGYTGSSQFMFGPDSNVLETRQTNADGYPLNEPLMDADASSFGFLGQIPRNFSLSDLTADYSQSSDILEYERSPFLDQADDKRLHAISEGFNYDDFSSD